MVKFIQHKLAILTVLKWETQWAISFGKFIIWCNHHYLPVLDHFPHLKKEPCSLSCHSTSSLPQPLKVKVAQSCLALCHPMDCTVHGILQARILEWVAFPSPGDLPDQEIEPRSLALQVDFLSAEPQGKPNTICFLPQWIYQFWNFHTNGIVQYEVFLELLDTHLTHLWNRDNIPNLSTDVDA